MWKLLVGCSLLYSARSVRLILSAYRRDTRDEKTTLIHIKQMESYFRQKLYGPWGEKLNRTKGRERERTILVISLSNIIRRRRNVISAFKSRFKLMTIPPPATGCHACIKDHICCRVVTRLTFVNPAGSCLHECTVARATGCWGIEVIDLMYELNSRPCVM